MSVQVENLEKNMAKLTIEVPAEELEKALEKAYQKQKKNISVPGFRKGKVPRAMVEKMYGPAVFYEDRYLIWLIWNRVFQSSRREQTGHRIPSGDQRRADRKRQSFHLYRNCSSKTGSYPWRVQRSGSSKS